MRIEASAPRPPIPFADYCRVFSVISCVIEDHSDVHHACNLFAMIGAHILREHYRLAAKAVSGAAVYCLNPELNPLAFAKNLDGRLAAGLDGFHSWVECKGYAIDFLAPLFPENVAEIDSQAEVPRRAFMKPLSLMSSMLPQKGDAEGTFLLIPNEACEANMIETFCRTPISSDLQTICTRWYRRPPKKMDTEMLIRDDRGEVTKLKRRDIEIRGFW
jgi:hypothetical protein